MTFEEKCFLCYNLLTDQISLSDCLYFSRYWSICVLHLFVNQAVTSFWNYFEINLILLIKPFCYTTKNQNNKLNILRMKRAFGVKLKAFFIILKGLSVAKNYVRTEGPPLIILVKLLKTFCSYWQDYNLIFVMLLKQD